MTEYRKTLKSGETFYAMENADRIVERIPAHLASDRYENLEDLPASHRTALETYARSILPEFMNDNLHPLETLDSDDVIALLPAYETLLIGHMYGFGKPRDKGAITAISKELEQRGKFEVHPQRVMNDIFTIVGHALGDDNVAVDSSITSKKDGKLLLSNTHMSLGHTMDYVEQEAIDTIPEQLESVYGALLDGAIRLSLKDVDLKDLLFKIAGY